MLNRLAVIVLSSIFLSFNAGVQLTAERNIAKLEGKTDSDCSDEFSKVNISIALLQNEKSAELINASTIFLAVSLAWIGLEIFLIGCCVGCAAFQGACCKEACCSMDNCREFKYFMYLYRKFN